MRVPTTVTTQSISQLNPSTRSPTDHRDEVSESHHHLMPSQRPSAMAPTSVNVTAHEPARAATEIQALRALNRRPKKRITTKASRGRNGIHTSCGVTVTNANGKTGPIIL